MIPVIGLASGLGGSHSGSSLGPVLIKKNWLSEEDWREMIHPSPNITDKKAEIVSINQQLASEVCRSVQESHFSIVVGGDHSCGIGTWSGASTALAMEKKELGLIWLDAHLDCHTTKTSPSGNIHGMPVASLLGHGCTTLTEMLSVKPKVKPENLFFVGIRSYESEEKALVEKLGIRVYYIDEVLERGLSKVLLEILQTFKKKNISYGMSLDIDFFDPEQMSATGTPEEGGIHPEEFLACCSLFKTRPPTVFEYVEFNPPLDNEGESREWSIKILQKIYETQKAFTEELITV